ncbi:NINE protein [Hymenobacter radiodurans]|uniref:NINE protein n=1 Tax=Hymenobacter radiodurans TaxID=2496028 RepID=UPI00105904D0|nr:NINE protein [Hymenobacter radiodurans]
MKNKTTAAVLAFFFGSIGIQYFYLGKPLKGALCILFCWTLIPCLIALIHVIYYLTVSEAVFNATYNPPPVRVAQPVAVTRPAQQPATVARATPVVSGPSPQPATPPAIRSSMRPAYPSMRRARQQPEAILKADELLHLLALKEKGALTEAEYIVEKARLLV